MNTYEIINICANSVSLLIIFMLLIGALIGGNLREKTNFWFVLLLVFCLLGVIAEWTIYLLSSNTSRTAIISMQIMDYLSHVLASIQMILFARYIYEYLYPKTSIKKIEFYAMAFWGIMNIIMGTIAQFISLYGFYDEFNIYQHNFYGMAILFPSIFQLSYLGVVFKHKKSMSLREVLSLTSYAIIYFSLYIFIWKKPGLWIVYLGPAIALFLVYINIQIESKQLLNESRTAIMLSQIQPHFLYNTLDAISSQCKNSPEAKHSILLFSQYLRSNMDSLSRTMPIPFDDELEHTKHYLALEKIRFEDFLQIEYKIQVTNFMIPVLTIQPIVENAVRHGVTQKITGGTVSISTEETPHSYQVIVEDDGLGFDPDAMPKSDRRHVGIQNVRYRLNAMCSGTLTINSIQGSGTTVIIEIPKRGVVQ